MGRIVIAAALCATLAIAGCGSEKPAPTTSAPPAITLPVPPAEQQTSPERFPVGVRVLHLSRGEDRPLRTLLLFPATRTLANPGPPPAPERVWPRGNSTPRPGRFPLVLFSHGLHGTPQSYQWAAASWAALGFVIALPAYPHTNHLAKDYRRKDMVNQPADAEYVIRKVIALASKAGDPLRGHLDTSRIAAIGHSAGGYTTTGLFHEGHDPRLRAGVVISGWMAPGRFGGPAAKMLFLHADNDAVIPIGDGRAAYDQVPWPKQFVVLRGAAHSAFMHPGKPGYTAMDRAVTNFLLQTLGDPRRPNDTRR